MDDLAQIIAHLRNEIVEINRRMEMAHRDGKIAEVDIDNHMLKADLGTDKEPMITNWIPWHERGGEQGSFETPIIGEPVSVISPNGDVAQARAHLGGLSADFPTPSKESGAKVIKAGGTNLTMRDGNFVANSAQVDLGGEGGKPVARIGDFVEITTGSSAGMWPIKTGSSVVNAVD